MGRSVLRDIGGKGVTLCSGAARARAAPAARTPKLHCDSVTALSLQGRAHPHSSPLS